MSRIVKLEGAKIVLKNCGIISIDESPDGAFNISFEGDLRRIRIGIPNDQDIEYMHVSTIFEKLTEE